MVSRSLAPPRSARLRLALLRLALDRSAPASRAPVSRASCRFASLRLAPVRTPRRQVLRRIFLQMHRRMAGAPAVRATPGRGRIARGSGAPQPAIGAPSPGDLAEKTPDMTTLFTEEVRPK